MGIAVRRRLGLIPWFRNRELYYFSMRISNHTHTVPALTYALSEKNQYNTMRLEDAYSIIEIAKAAGYDTWWISNQLKYGAYDTPIAEMASTVDHEVWINTHAGKLVKTSYYDEELVNRLPHISDNTPALLSYILWDVMVITLIGIHTNMHALRERMMKSARMIML
jgi:glucan phosphoethanolaminetransferase (alkaline phosphatase superfamily)